MAKKVVLAYSGGLDTSVAISWIREHYDAEIITVTVNLGNFPDAEEIRQRALTSGAIKAIHLDGQEAFAQELIMPALQSNAVYEGVYPLATALSRPLIARFLVQTALEEKAEAVAHGSTGKGNDQVRFDVAIKTMAPHLQIIAPAREWNMTREEEVEYALAHKIHIKTNSSSPYSMDVNLWGRSIECGVLEDPWREPPEDVYLWTRSTKDAPDEPLYIDIEFERGCPVALDGEQLSGAALILQLNLLAGEHGVGRVDHMENRLVGFKSREVYEVPAATVLLKSHRALEQLTLTKEQLRFKERVAQEYADLIYNGLWFTAHRKDLASYVASTQKYVSGTAKVKLWKGTCTVVGIKSPYSLYSYQLATYDKGDAFDHRSSEGFINIWSLPSRIQAQVQNHRPERKGLPKVKP